MVILRENSDNKKDESMVLKLGEKLRVLLADDGSAGLTEVAFLLRERGVEVQFCAHGGDSVMDALQYFGAHVVVCDALTETFGGVELAEKLSIFPPTICPEIIIYSGTISPLLLKAAKNAGIKYIFEKPVKPYDIVDAIVNLAPEAMEMKAISAYESTQTAAYSESKINELLLDFGFTMKYNGFDLLNRAISLSAEDAQYTKNITGSLYPKLAAEFCMASASVERAMRFSIKKAYESNEALFKSKFRNKQSPPTAKEFIKYAAEIIKSKSYPSTLHSDILKKITSEEK